jgi:recombination protein RecA
MDIRRVSQIKDGTGKTIGSRTRVKVVKNKIAPPFTECEFDIMYNEGISRTGSILDLGIEYNIVEKKGSWLAYKGKMLGQGREAAKQALAKDGAMIDEIQTAIYQKVKVAGGTVLGESSRDMANGDEL